VDVEAGTSIVGRHVTLDSFAPALPPTTPTPARARTTSNLIRLLLPLSFIHHLSILVHPLRINSVYPSLLLATCQTNICHPIDDTLAWYRKIKNTTSSRKHASRCRIGILMMNLVVRTPSLSQCIGSRNSNTHANKSSITVDSVLYTMAFMGICDTL
jgi:hypothetical protein